jgi:hypothetical protein
MNNLREKLTVGQRDWLLWIVLIIHRASALQLAASQVNEFLQSHTVLGQFLLADVGDSEEQAAVAFVGV